jgi:hypothetical protein
MLELVYFENVATLGHSSETVPLVVCPQLVGTNHAKKTVEDDFLFVCHAR